MRSTGRGWLAWALGGRAVVPAASPTLTPRSSSRRPRPAPASSGCRSRTGASANSPATCPGATAAPTRAGRQPSGCGLGRERLRQILAARGITFQRTRTWKESHDPDLETKLDRIEEVTTRLWDRCFAFDQFGPLSIRPCHGTCWATKKHPDRLRATYKRTHGIRYFHGCYDLAEDRLWGVLHKHKGGRYTLAALKSIRQARPDGAPIYVILDNLSTNTTPAIRTWCHRNKVELCLTPTNASWANPIEAQFGPLRQFTIANSDHPNHPALAREMHSYPRWRNANNRHPDILAAQRRERARIRSERHRKWGRPQSRAA